MEAAELEPSTQRYCLAIAYDGGRFHGCQAQRGVPTVHGALDAALREINVTRRAAKAQRPMRSSEPPTSDCSRAVIPTSLKTSDDPRNESDAGSSNEAPSPISIVFAGRTDQGVHATRMVVHVDLPRRHKPTPGDSSGNTNSLRNGGEALPAAVVAASLRASLQRAGAAVSITSVTMVPSSFHARVSASERVYEYLIAVPCDDDAARRRRANDLGDDNEMLSDPCAGFSLESPKAWDTERGEKVDGATMGTSGAPPASALHGQRMWAVSRPLLTHARAKKLGFGSKVLSTDEERPPFSADLFKQALAAFEGTNNFDAFRAKSCPAPCAVRTVSECRVVHDSGSSSTADASAGAASAFNSSVTVDGPGSSRDPSFSDSITPLAVSSGRLMTVRIRAPAFLYHQVRCMVGAAAHVATGELRLDQLMAWLAVPSEPDGARETMDAANSTSLPDSRASIKGAAVPLMAPAAGLYFAGALYRREAMVPLPAGVIYRPPLSRTDDAAGAYS